MTTLGELPELDVWGEGHYDLMAPLLRPAAETLAHAITHRAGEGSGRDAVDLAAGTGSLAIALARSGWGVTALDSSPSMLAGGAAACRNAGAEVDWRLATLESLPLQDTTVDLAASSFGLIFGADEAGVIDQVYRALRPGGTLALTAWSHDGLLARESELIGTFFPPSDASLSDAPPSPFRWGEPSMLRAVLAAGFMRLNIVAHTLPWHFDSSAAATDFLFTNSPGHVMARRAADNRACAMREAVRANYQDLAEADGSIRLELDYLTVLATRI